MVLSIFESVEKIANSFKGWILENGSNPVLWIGLFMLGLAVFAFTYNALNKNK